MNQNAKAFIWQFTYTICLKSVKASEYKAVLWRAGRLIALAIPAASFPAPQLFPTRNQTRTYVKSLTHQTTFIS